MTDLPNSDRSHRRARALFAVLGLSVVLGACTYNDRNDFTASVPTDYRHRHPIAIQDAERSVDVFVGAGRGGLTATQRAEIMSLASAWLREGTGTLVIHTPARTPNARAASDAVREIKSLFAAAGIPDRGITVRSYHADDPRQLATLRVTYPRIVAVAGPCGLWPEDLGPSIKNPGYYNNRPYYNLGCASQRNLAAMVANPSDLVQPRSEDPAYTPRRNTVLERYRAGERTGAELAESDRNKASSVGK